MSAYHLLAYSNLVLFLIRGNRMKVTVRNCDWVRGSLYFRKRISHKHLVSGKKKVEIKKALRPVTKKYYHIFRHILTRE